jgi:hypothetical protein
MNVKSYFYKLIQRYLQLFIRATDVVVEIDPMNDFLVSNLECKNISKLLTEEPIGLDNSKKKSSEIFRPLSKLQVDYILLNGNFHYIRDIQFFMTELFKVLNGNERIIVTYYNSIWKPFISLATKLRLRKKLPEQNWIAHEDIDNLMLLSGYEVVRRDSKVLCPIYIPIVSSLLNKFFSPLPFFRWFNLLNFAIIRPKKNYFKTAPSVSIVVPARNEEGNIENIVRRIPKMGPKDELIFVEGNSTDSTWAKIQEVTKINKYKLNIKICQQEGKGKGDAVRKGFSIATKEIFMILDADLTVPPEDLPKFYDAITENKGEFINGSRLVYPMEKKAMKFFNILGNKFFAMAFSYVLSQRFKDTLCGTKVLTKENYLKIVKNRGYFGEFDPFGDFDLIFGSARMGLKIVEVPIGYKERTYGDTNIQRWKHGVILLRMLVFAARKIKFL